MSRDDIIHLARQAGGYANNFNGRWMFYVGDIEKFAALVAAAEREAGSNTPRPEYCTTAAELEMHILRDEIERLTRALHYEQHWLSRIGTHGPGCWGWGPNHYECALRKVKEWNSLTGEEIQTVHDAYHKRMGPMEFARAIEAKLRELNA